ncbi:MAG: radical SAM protein, partial [Desulfovibrionaceae bacterium]|nr:radical SAM protein [Desulfovibrionaceae bacterium]
FLQAAFALALLREARARYIRTAVETCGMCDQDVLLEAGQHLNYVLFDIKHMDSDVHREQTGMPNKQILANLQALCREYPDKPILVRTPIIPGFNNTPEAVTAIAEFIEPLGDHVEYEMLPYHRLGTQKYEFLDRPAPMGDVVLDDIEFKRLLKYAHRVLKSRLHVAK